MDQVGCLHSVLLVVAFVGREWVVVQPLAFLLVPSFVDAFVVEVVEVAFQAAKRMTTNKINNNFYNRISSTLALSKLNVHDIFPINQLYNLCNKRAISERFNENKNE